ncbi:MAG: hypothetical protein ACD_19C00426G0103 [uncultured bacterium]|nr:MAG: hypothetical protein ACD_19C00426G0103 [uncultured bacterium]
MKDNDIKIVGLSNASKPKGKTNWKIVGAIVGIVVLAFGVIAGIILVRQQQDIREKAGVTYGRCDEAGAEACPGTDGILRNCHPPESDNTPALSSCDTAGRIEFCGTRNYCCPVAGGTWTADMSACAVATATPTSSTRPDYCVSASADKAVLNSNDTLTVSSVSNTPVNGFGYAVYNLDNLYGPENPKPVCVGAGNVTSDCPNGGTHFILSDPDTNTLRTNGSTQITFGRLFITDKNTGQQLKNVSFMAYFSLNGGQVSWPQNACKAFTRMGTISTATSTSTATATSTSTTHATATATSTTSSGNNTSTPTATSTSTSGLAGSTATTVPLPVTGAKWPTMLGAGFGIMMILVSLALAL